MTGETEVLPPGRNSFCGWDSWSMWMDGMLVVSMVLGIVLDSSLLVQGIVDTLFHDFWEMICQKAIGSFGDLTLGWQENYHSAAPLCCRHATSAQCSNLTFLVGKIAKLHPVSAHWALITTRFFQPQLDLTWAGLQLECDQIGRTDPSPSHSCQAVCKKYGIDLSEEVEPWASVKNSLFWAGVVPYFGCFCAKLPCRSQDESWHEFQCPSDMVCGDRVQAGFVHPWTVVDASAWSWLCSLLLFDGIIKYSHPWGSQKTEECSRTSFKCNIRQAFYSKDWSTIVPS